MSANITEMARRRRAARVGGGKKRTNARHAKGTLLRGSGWMEARTVGLVANQPMVLVRLLDNNARNRPAPRQSRRVGGQILAVDEVFSTHSDSEQTATGFHS